MTDEKRSRERPEAVTRSSLRRLLQMKSAPIVRGDDKPDAVVIRRAQRAGGKGRRFVPPHRSEAVAVLRFSAEGKAPSVRLTIKKSERRAGVRSTARTPGGLQPDPSGSRSAMVAARLRDLQQSRWAARLIDEGISVHELALRLRVDRETAERYVRRRALLSTAVSPEELILLRAAGRSTARQMMQRLGAMTFTAAPPPYDSWFDSATPSTGTAKQLMRAYQDGLLTQAEYERLTQTVTVEPVT